MSSVISHAEREFIASGIAADVRSDGRGRLQWRPFDITKHVVGKAHGSAHTFLDGTEVMVAIYGEVVDKRSAGLHFHVDCTPTVVATYNLTRTASGKEGFNTLIASKMAMLYGVHYSNALREEMPVLFTTKEQKVKTTKYIDNVQREIVPTSSLMDCTDYGWILYVDIMIVGCAGGNVFGATSLAVKAALINVRLPKIEVSSSGEVMLHEQSATGLTNAQNYPLATVIQVHGSCYCVDPSLTEEAAPHTTLLLGTTLDGQITLCESLPSLTGCNAGLIRPLDLACVMNEGVAILEPVHLTCITQAQ